MEYGNEPNGKNLKKYLTDFVNHWKSKDSRRVYTGASGWPYLANADYNSSPDPRIQRWGEGLKSIINAKAPNTMYDWKDIIVKDMPYRELGVVKNATKDLLLNIENLDHDRVRFKIFATSMQSVEVTLKGENGQIYYKENVQITPEQLLDETVDVKGTPFNKLILEVASKEKRMLQWHDRYHKSIRCCRTPLC